MTTVAKRSASFLNKSSFLASAWVRQQENAYHPKENPDGVINLGTSENKLTFDLLSERLTGINLAQLPESYTHYCDFTGLTSFREALAKFMTRYMKAHRPVQPENLSVMVGVGTVVEALAFALFDEGDGVLIPTPAYGAFYTDLSSRANTLPISVHLSSQPCEAYGETEPFELNIQRIEEAYKSSKARGINVKGLLLTNPNNPLGSVYSEKFIKQCLDFCHQNQMHIIIDEVYLFCLFGENTAERLKCTLAFEEIPDPNRTHVLWGFSKDFGLSGFRCGLVHSWNRDLHFLLQKSAYFCSVPTICQYALEPIISDFDWLDNVYIPQYQKKLREVQEYTRAQFQKEGIYCHPAESGLFVWVDMRKYLKHQTFDAEKELFEEFFKEKVYVSPSQAFFCHEPGWFRLIIAMDMDILSKGLERFFTAARQYKKSICKKEGQDELGSLVELFIKEVRSSDWLTENTAEKWQSENPELAREFLEEKAKYL